MRDHFSEVWETASAAATGAGIASSTAVAGTFFAPTGIAAWLGLATAATPIGWVVAAGVVAGAGYLGASRWLRGKVGDFSDTIPRYINTPIDVLGVALMEFLGRISLKLASMDGDIHESERAFMSDHFVSEWGYDPAYVAHALAQIERDIGTAGTKDLTRALTRPLVENPDCNATVMQRELVDFLRGLSQADGTYDERQDFAVEAIKRVFREESKVTLAQIRKKIVESGKDWWNKRFSSDSIKNFPGVMWD